HEGGHHVGEDHHVPDGHHGQFTELGLLARRGHKHTLALKRNGNKAIGRARRPPVSGRIQRLMLGLYSGSGSRMRDSSAGHLPPKEIISGSEEFQNVCLAERSVFMSVCVPKKSAVDVLFCSTDKG